MNFDNTGGGDHTALDMDAVAAATGRNLDIEEAEDDSDYVPPEGEWYFVRLNTIVRHEADLKSHKLCVLQVGNNVHVVEKRGRRCRINVPVHGWCSQRSAQNDIILEKRDLPPAPNEIRIPEHNLKKASASAIELLEASTLPLSQEESIMTQTVAEQQTTILKLQRQIRELSVVNESLLARLQGDSIDLTPEFPQAMSVSGIEGAMGTKLNGVYKRTGMKEGGRCVWEQDSDENDVCLWYWEEKEFWLFSRREHVGTEHSYALAKEFPQAEIHHRFLVYEPDERQHVKQTLNFSFSVRKLL